MYLVLQTTKITSEREKYVTTISSRNFNNTFPEMSIQILNELIQIYTNMSGNGTGGVRIVAFLLYEVEHLFPNEIAGRNE